MAALAKRATRRTRPISTWMRSTANKTQPVVHATDAKQSVGYVLQNLRTVYGVPRRETGRDPLDVLVRAILSQSTTNVNSRRSFESLKGRFPSWDAARRARASTIEAAIRSGGLAGQKSARIKRLLNEIHSVRGKTDLSWLCRAGVEEASRFLSELKGVGPTTAALTLLFACGYPRFPADTHILRIAIRLGLMADGKTAGEAQELMAGLVPRERFYEAHINLIRLGREVCKPGAPLCEKCCLVDYCDYYQGQVF